MISSSLLFPWWEPHPAPPFISLSLSISPISISSKFISSKPSIPPVISSEGISSSFISAGISSSFIWGGISSSFIWGGISSSFNWGGISSSFNWGGISSSFISAGISSSFIWAGISSSFIWADISFLFILEGISFVFISGCIWGSILISSLFSSIFSSTGVSNSISESSVVNASVASDTSWVVFNILVISVWSNSPSLFLSNISNISSAVSSWFFSPPEKLKQLGINSGKQIYITKQPIKTNIKLSFLFKVSTILPNILNISSKHFIYIYI